MIKTLSQFLGTVAASFILLVVVGAGCVPIEPTATTNSTTTAVTAPNVWSTFTSPLLQYTIEYPATWYTWSGSEFFEDMQEAETDVDYVSILPKEGFSTISPDQILVAIDRDTKQPLVPGEAATEDFNAVIAANSKTATVSNVQALVLDENLPAVQQVEQDPDDTTGEYGYSVVTYVDAGNVVYTIYVTAASAADYARYEGIIQTIIASFDRL